MKISYSWLQDYFEEKLPEPEAIAEGIIFHSFEVEDVLKVANDTIFDIKILPDRAHDCLSHFGIAKEISAIFDLKIADENLDKIEPKATSLEIDIVDDKCLRYMGRIVRNVKVGESPDWLKEKLNVIGQKSINNIVDIANFVMFDLGQPIHCFDLDKLASEKLIIRNGKVGEKLTTLDKKEVNLDESILVIADENDPLAIAGIKGGTKAEVDMNTRNIVIEVANFNPTTTRKTSKKINILTDAVKRYENEISPELCALAMDEISSLIYDLAGGEVEDFVDVYPSKREEKRRISFSNSYAKSLLGIEIKDKEIEEILKRFGYEYENKDGVFTITVLPFRLDMSLPCDVVEEIGRIYGYDKIVPVLPKIDFERKENITWKNISLTKKYLASLGYREVMNYCFVDKGEVELFASASDKNFLRTNLTDGIKKSFEFNKLNLPLLGDKEIKIFEVGTVFNKNGEEIHVCFADKKEIVEMSLDKFVNAKIPKEFSLDKLDNFKLSTAFKPWSVYPFIVRDIAVWIPLESGENDTINKENILKIYKEFGGEILNVEPILFDEFTKGDKTSVGYRLIFQSYERTLTDDEVSGVMTKINTKISELGGEVR